MQFGTGGNPYTSAPYQSDGAVCREGGPGARGCGTIEPQPDAMPFVMSVDEHGGSGTPGLSNVFGTLNMSTSVNEEWNEAMKAGAQERGRGSVGGGLRRTVLSSSSPGRVARAPPFRAQRPFAHAATIQRLERDDVERDSGALHQHRRQCRVPRPQALYKLSVPT